jgi:hypothetical protein
MAADYLMLSDIRWRESREFVDTHRMACAHSLAQICWTNCAEMNQFVQTDGMKMAKMGVE